MMNFLIKMKSFDYSQRACKLTSRLKHFNKYQTVIFGSNENSFYSSLMILILKVLQVINGTVVSVFRRPEPKDTDLRCFHSYLSRFAKPRTKVHSSVIGMKR